MKKEKWYGDRYWANANSYPPKKYEMIVLDPLKEIKEIEWGKILERNGKKSLAEGEWATYSPYVWYGAGAFTEAARDSETSGYFWQEEQEVWTYAQREDIGREDYSPIIAGVFNRIAALEGRLVARFLTPPGKSSCSNSSLAS
ncbi:hypothetical protein KGY64_02985 [Candidatus Bipolaricaulota bacterium]|nr:hypothetical protein [Candidatus Bipolaricaulota bacterium]